jgi:hypothetical protein
MPQRIIIGNLISFSGAALLIFSAITENKRRLYLYGVFECILLFIAQLFFGQGAAAVSLLIAAFRNFLIYIGKYSKEKLIAVFVASLVLGLLFNTGGALGLIPLFATLIFTVTSYYAKSYIKVKLSFLFNLFLWTVYSALIFDIASTVVNFFSLVLSVISVLKYYKNKKRSEK